MEILQKKKYNMIIVAESGGFFLLIMMIWLEEIFDIAALIFKTSPTPFNFMEAIIESTYIAIIGFSIIVFTFRIIKRLEYLEEFIRICAACKKVFYEDKWIEIEEFVQSHSKVKFSHGFCPKCFEKALEEI